MRGQTLILSLAVALCLPAVSRSALIVDTPRPITHRVSVQLIQTAPDEGSPFATAFGDIEQRAAIESMVDTIWAQAGIDVQFAPNVIQYNSTFAYEGTSDPRPSGDLNRILSQAESTGGILNPDESVINMFFVNVVPGWGPRSEGWVNGLSNISRGGISFFVGDDALTSVAGLERIAHWVAHEIGHNLGLKHLDTALPNLMNETRVSQQLTEEQITAIVQRQTREDEYASIPAGGTGLVRPLLPIVSGDYNNDGVVNGADYTIWRNAHSSFWYLPSADGDGNGSIGLGDYQVWKSNYGKILDANGGGAISTSLSIPEPHALFLATSCAAFLVCVRTIFAVSRG